MDFSSNNIANAKQLKHVVDHMLLEKKIAPDEYENYLITDDWDNVMTLKEYNDNLSKIDSKYKWFYYGQKVDKNRKGQKGMVLCTKVNLDLNVWEEIGILTKNYDNLNANRSYNKNYNNYKKKDGKKYN